MVRRTLLTYLTLISSILVLSSKTTMAGKCIEGHCDTCTCTIYASGGVICGTTNSLSKRCIGTDACTKFCQTVPKCTGLSTPPYIQGKCSRKH